MIPAYLLNRIHEKCFWCGETVTPHNAPDPRPQVEGLLDIDHVMHAYDLLTPGGMLVSVMGEGAFFRNDRKAVAFREWFFLAGGESESLPDGSFRESGTGVNARLVWMSK